MARLLSTDSIGTLAGIEAIIAIRSEFPDARIVVLTTYAGERPVARALKAGARGYLLKGNVHTDLLATIRDVHAGKKRVPAEVATELAMHTAEDNLTARELEILKLIAQGNANKEIAAQFAVQEDTVKSHDGNILDKLGRTTARTLSRSGSSGGLSSCRFGAKFSEDELQRELGGARSADLV